MRPNFLALLMQPVISLPAPSKRSFANKTAIVTGGNTGLGLETARHLLKAGCKRVIIASRNSSKGDAARKSLLGTPDLDMDAIVQVWSLDLTSFASVKSFAERANALEELDYVFLNAGMGTGRYVQSSDGWETMLQVNALSTTLLALLLLPKLIQQSRRRPNVNYPRLVITSSGLHAAAQFAERDAENSIRALNTEACFKRQPNHLEIYSVTKLFNIYLMRELVKHIPKDSAGHPQVLVSAAAPGLCRSEFRREGTSLSFKLVLKLFAHTTEYGSRNLIAAAGEKSQATYISEGAATEPGGLATGEEALRWQQKVWSEMVEVLRLVAPEIEETLQCVY